MPCAAFTQPQVPSGQQSQHGHVIELVPSSIPAEAFDKLGGWDALIMVVSKYFDALAADPLLSFVFAHVDRSTYVRKLSLFLGHAVLGKLPYDARTLWIRHKHLIHNHGIGVAHVDRMIQILAGTLESVNAPPDVIRVGANCQAHSSS